MGIGRLAGGLAGFLRWGIVIVGNIEELVDGHFWAILVQARTAKRAFLALYRLTVCWVPLLEDICVEILFLVGIYNHLVLARADPGYFALDEWWLMDWGVT